MIIIKMLQYPEMIKMRETASPRHKWRGFKRGGFSTTHF